jgi:hypothetical protein
MGAIIVQAVILGVVFAVVYLVLQFVRSRRRDD